MVIDMDGNDDKDDNVDAGASRRPTDRMRSSRPWSTNSITAAGPTTAR